MQRTGPQEQTPGGLPEGAVASDSNHGPTLTPERARAALESTLERSGGDAGGAVTELLREWRAGDDEALEHVMPHFYRRLRAFAARLMQSERPGHTLQATALVHEGYLKLVRLRRIAWRDRAQFFTVYSHLMRNILVDHARRRAALRRAGDRVRVEIPAELAGPEAQRTEEVLAVHRAVERLAGFDPELGDLVVLRYFAGLSLPELALVKGVSRSTVKRQWALARAWLIRDLTAEPAPDDVEGAMP